MSAPKHTPLSRKNALALRMARQHVVQAWGELESLGAILFARGDPFRVRDPQLALADVRRALDFAIELDDERAALAKAKPEGR